MTVNPRSDKKLGSACTGVDGASNRTLTLDFTNAVSTGMNVWVGAVWQEPDTDYTFSTVTNAITFLKPVENIFIIYVSYFSNDWSSPTSSSVYTNTLQVVRTAGVGVEVFDEVVGTGNSSATSFDLDNGNVIDGSYILRYGTSGSNSLTNLTEITHYVLSIDEGRILLTAAGVTALGTNILYASYVHSPKMSNTNIASYLLASDKEIERKTGNYWGTVKSETEYFSGRNTAYPTTDEPYATDWDEPDSLTLKYKGCTALTSVKFLTRGGTVVTEQTIALTSVDLNPDTSVVTFLNDRIPNGTRNVQIVYSHGYATVDSQISELTALFASLRVFAAITGGSYDDTTGFTLGRLQVQIGEVYVNAREVVNQLQNRISSILNDVGYKMDVM